MTGARHTKGGTGKPSPRPVHQMIVKVDLEEYRELRSHLAKHGLTVSSVIRDLLRNYMDSWRNI